MNDDVLKELEALEKAATKAPWEAETWMDTNSHGWAACGPLRKKHNVLEQEPGDANENEAMRDAFLIKQLRNHAKDLIQSAKREAKLRQALEDHRRQHLEVSHHCISCIKFLDRVLAEDK